VLISLFDAVVRREMEIWDAVEQAVRPVAGIQLGSFQALRVIDQHGGRGRVRDVAADLGVTVGAASKIVDRLVNRGLVNRWPHASDGRSSWLGLSPAGTEVLTIGVEAMAIALRSHLDARLSAAEQLVTLQLLRCSTAPVQSSVAW
jgi:DNA-binding MarR family transcriptional regulator